MDRQGYQVVVPEVPADIQEEEFLPLDSGYMKRAKHILPKNGSKRPWRVYQNYFMDMLLGKIAIDKGISELSSKWRSQGGDKILAEVNAAYLQYK